MLFCGIVAGKTLGAIQQEAQPGDARSEGDARC
jgi:hypothetical protein